MCISTFVFLLSDLSGSIENLLGIVSGLRKISLLEGVF